MRWKCLAVVGLCHLSLGCAPALPDPEVDAFAVGFTLIELLIVVAIIAILAAIAVPNFLEAQTRSKVSRVKADMRTLATALEAYTVDFNRAPIGYNEGETAKFGAGQLWSVDFWPGASSRRP